MGRHVVIRQKRKVRHLVGQIWILHYQDTDVENERHPDSKQRYNSAQSHLTAAIAA